MFPSTSHQMMRKLDTGSVYRVQFKTSVGYNMAKLDNSYNHELEAHALEQKKLELHKQQLDDYKKQMDVVKEAHDEHAKVEGEHTDLIKAAIDKKRAAEDAKKLLDNNLKKLENLTLTENHVKNPRNYSSSTTTHPTPSNKNGNYAHSGEHVGGRTQVGFLHR